MEQYEALKQGEVSRITVDSFDGLGLGLIKARIASGLGQKALAERLGLKEQQIQRYEADRYGSASYRRLQQIVRGLGINIREEILFSPSTPPRILHLVDKLRQVGVKTDFFYSRLLPSRLAAQVQEGVTGTDESQCAARVGDILSRIFGWTPSELFGTGELPLPRNAAAAARFKVPARRALAGHWPRPTCIPPTPTISQHSSSRVAATCHSHRLPPTLTRCVTLLKRGTVGPLS